MRTKISARVISLEITTLALAFTLASAQASAIVIDSVGDEFTVHFNGIIDNVEQAGLTSSADFSLVNIDSDAADSQVWTFNVSLSNSSSSPITESRVSVLGFNTSSELDINASSTSGLFDVTAAGNMPMVGDLDICFKGGGSSNNCAGGGNGGVSLGESGDFMISLSVNSELSALELTDFYVRYQSVGNLSGIGTGIPAVPAPSAMLLMGSALIGLAGLARKRN